MKKEDDLFAPPTEDEMNTLFAPPTEEETSNLLAPPPEDKSPQAEDELSGQELLASLTAIYGVKTGKMLYDKMKIAGGELNQREFDVIKSDPKAYKDALRPQEIADKYVKLVERIENLGRGYSNQAGKLLLNSEKTYNKYNDVMKSINNSFAEKNAYIKKQGGKVILTKTFEDQYKPIKEMLIRYDDNVTSEQMNSFMKELEALAKNPDNVLAKSIRDNLRDQIDIAVPGYKKLLDKSAETFKDKDPLIKAFSLKPIEISSGVSSNNYIVQPKTIDAVRNFIDLDEEARPEINRLSNILKKYNEDDLLKQTNLSSIKETVKKGTGPKSAFVEASMIPEPATKPARMALSAIKSYGSKAQELAARLEGSNFGKLMSKLYNLGDSPNKPDYDKLMSVPSVKPYISKVAPKATIDPSLDLSEVHLTKNEQKELNKLNEPVDPIKVHDDYNKLAKQKYTYSQYKKLYPEGHPLRKDVDSTVQMLDDSMSKIRSQYPEIKEDLSLEVKKTKDSNKENKLFSAMEERQKNKLKLDMLRANKTYQSLTNELDDLEKTILITADPKKAELITTRINEINGEVNKLRSEYQLKPNVKLAVKQAKEEDKLIQQIDTDKSKLDDEMLKQRQSLELEQDKIKEKADDIKSKDDFDRLKEQEIISEEQNKKPPTKPEIKPPSPDNEVKKLYNDIYNKQKLLNQSIKANNDEGVIKLQQQLTDAIANKDKYISENNLKDSDIVNTGEIKLKNNDNIIIKTVNKPPPKVKPEPKIEAPPVQVSQIDNVVNEATKPATEVGSEVIENVAKKSSKGALKKGLKMIPFTGPLIAAMTYSDLTQAGEDPATALGGAAIEGANPLPGVDLTPLYLSGVQGDYPKMIQDANIESELQESEAEQAQKYKQSQASKDSKKELFNKYLEKKAKPFTIEGEKSMDELAGTEDVESIFGEADLVDPEKQFEREAIQRSDYKKTDAFKDKQKWLEMRNKGNIEDNKPNSDEKLSNIQASFSISPAAKKRLGIT